MNDFKMPEILPPKSRKSEGSQGAEFLDRVDKNTGSTSGERDDPPPPQKRDWVEERTQDKIKKYNEILSALNYQRPENAASADARYYFEVLKNGTIVEHCRFSKLDNKGFYVVGRVPGCDFIAENPTVSRIHAILQFVSCEKEGPGIVGNGESGIPDRSGLYVYDLNSTHGTFINKNQIFPKRYYRLHVGHVLKFGNSPRLYILSGPADDEEEESEKSVTELQNERLKREMERKKLDDQGNLIKFSGEDEDGCSWGLADDAVEEADTRENPFAINFEKSEGFDNPKKTLRGWFEREGYDLYYDCREKAAGQFICRINLPIDGPSGQPVFAEVDVKGKKKEAVHQAALQACQILDKYGVLRVSQQESRMKRKEKNWAEDDYYSSDEDTFLDRTGSVEKKREKRMKIAGKKVDKVETFDSLTEKAQSLRDEIASLQSQIGIVQTMNRDDEDVDLDDYVKLLKTGATDVKKLKSKMREATEELKKVEKLLNIVKPASISLFSNSAPNTKTEVQAIPSSEVQPKLEANCSPKIQTPESSSTSNKVVVATDLTPKSDQHGKSKTKPTSKLYGPKFPPKQMPQPKSKTHKDNSSEGEEKDEAKNVSSDSDSSGDEVKITKTKKPQQRHKVTKEVKFEYDSTDPKYSTWIPPPDQRGDGKTSLNEKLGY